MLYRYLLFVFFTWIFVGFLNGSPVQAVTRLDAAFGLNGRIAVELGVKNSAHAVVVQPDGKIVVAGSSAPKGAALNFSLLRFNKDGSLDPTFNGDGSVITSVSNGDDEALALGLLSDGRIIAAGYSHNGTNRDFTLVCYLEDGTLDWTFGNDGVVVTTIGNNNEEITAIKVNAEDMITVAGAAEGTVGRALVTARYFADGVLDRSYGEQGISLIGVGEDSSAEGIIERADGSLVISGSYKDKQEASLMLVGLNANGILAAGFGDKGVAVPSGSFRVSEGYGLAEGNDGYLYLAGSVGMRGKRDAALFRFTKTGKADLAFGDKGVLVTAVSEEDDVLYAVTAGENGVVASGYTTTAGTRQFLLITFSGGGTSPAASTTTSAGSSTVDNVPTKLAPIQEVRVIGGTKVQIRRLQLSSSLSKYTTVQYAPPLPPTPLEVSTPARASTARYQQADRHFFFDPWLAAALKRIGDFLLPSAVAADSKASAPDIAVSAHVVTSSFSEGESVSYAATFDAAGNVVAVGTADGLEASSIVVAQYAAESTADSSIVDQPGYRSSHITTTPPIDITKTTTVNGGEILPSFGKTVTRRGVVFSLSKDLSYSGNKKTATPSPAITIGRLKEAEALAKAATALAAPADVVPTTEAILSAVDFVEDGETVNGSGYGAFSAPLEKLKPGTTYYVRAYALTSEGTVYYGNRLSFRTADACFIATASFGTLLHPGVRVLRDFRDTFLAHNALGQQLVDLYYTFSPPLADCIAGNELFRFIIRLLLLPFIGFSWLALQLGIVSALVTFIGAVTMCGWITFRVSLRR